MSVVEPFAVPEIFVDDFEDFEVRDGIMSWVGVRMQQGVSVAVVRLLMRTSGISKAVQKRDEALSQAGEEGNAPRKTIAKHLS